MKSQIKEEFSKIIHSENSSEYGFSFMDLNVEKEVSFSIIQGLTGTFLEIRNVFPSEKAKDEYVYIPFHRIRKIKHKGNIVFEYIKGKGITRS